MSIGESGMGTVGPTGEVKGLMVTGFNVVDQEGGTVGEGAGGGVEGEDAGDNGECDGEEGGEFWGDGGSAEGG